MSAALLWAENESWLAPCEPSCDAWRHVLECVRPDRRTAQSELPSQAELGRANKGAFASDTPLAMANITPDERGMMPRAILPSAPSLRSLAISALLHVGLAAMAATFLPNPREQAERGGTPASIDVLVIGADEAQAVFEGARPQPASVVPEPKLAEVERESPPAAAQNEASIPQTEAQPEPSQDAPSIPAPASMIELPAIDLSSLVSAPPSVERTPQHVPPEELKPVLPPPETPFAPAAKMERTVPKKEARTDAPKRIKPEKRQTQRAGLVRQRTNPEAEGRTGDGVAQTTRRASERGGTGGTASIAGSTALTSFRQRLVAHLTRYKNYPEQAQERGIGGRNAVTITLSREGRVLSAALAAQSGHSMLDSATLAAVRRAQPFPAIPDGGPATITVTIGLSYQLN